MESGKLKTIRFYALHSIWKEDQVISLVHSCRHNRNELHMDTVITKVHFLLELVSNKVTASDRNIFKYFLRHITTSNMNISKVMNMIKMMNNNIINFYKMIFFMNINT